jgi:hypothetical protein
MTAAIGTEIFVLALLEGRENKLKSKQLALSGRMAPQGWGFMQRHRRTAFPRGRRGILMDLYGDEHA